MGLRAKILILAELVACIPAGAATTEAVGRLSAPSGTVATAVAETSLETGSFNDVASLAELLGVSQDVQGRVVHSRPGSKLAAPRPLSTNAVTRIMHFLHRIDRSRVDAAYAAAMKSYLKPRIDAAALDNNEFVTTKRGVSRLTDLGKGVLVDILASEDGELINEIPAPDAGLLATPRRPIQPMSLDLRDAVGAVDPNAAAKTFDGRLPLAGFDWELLDRERTQSIGLKTFAPSVLEGYSQNREAGTVRVMIEAPAAASADRLGAAGPELSRGDFDPHLQRTVIYKETGLDKTLLDGHDAKVVRAIDNIVVVDVPLSRAAKLGKALSARGILSMPARIIRSSAKAAAATPAQLLGGQFLPIPTSGFDIPREEDTEDVKSRNLQSRDMMKINSLAAKGMWGQNTVAGIIDSGIDATHPDFKGRIRDEDYVDFTGEGLEDRLGHGTHVAGSIGGSGEASRGVFKGVAPKVRFVVAKVFGDTGESSEDIILAAMKWMVRKRPDSLNLSLGGPGDPNRDPLSAMANRLMIKENIMVVAAAGNEGPRKGSISAPGNARYVLTVTGVNKQGKFSFFPSRGPVNESDGNSFSKPDVTAVSGDVLPTEPQSFWKRVGSALTPATDAFAAPADPKCVFGPGVISTRSKYDKDDSCVLAGNPYYRFLTGTSMGTPLATGVENDIIGYAKTRGRKPLTTEVKAVLMETATSLGVERETEGAGLINGTRLAEAVADRVGQGLPIGNIAYMLSVRMMTTLDRQLLKLQTRFRETAAGLLDTEAGRLVNTEREMKDVLTILRRKQRPTKR